MKAANFVHKSISEAGKVLENFGFCHVQIKDFDIPRAKMFRYFNNLYGLVELVLINEIENCYKYIDFMVLHSLTNKKPLVVLHYYRSQFIQRSKLLTNFQRDKENLPAKFKGLKNEMERMEKSKLLNFLEDFEKVSNERLNIKNSFLTSLLLEVYLVQNGHLSVLSGNFIF